MLCFLWVVIELSSVYQEQQIQHPHLLVEEMPVALALHQWVVEDHSRLKANSKCVILFNTMVTLY